MIRFQALLGTNENENTIMEYIIESETEYNARFSKDLVNLISNSNIYNYRLALQL